MTTKTKKIQKPFSVEAWKNGAKVETRSGREVRILCTDLKDDYPIVAGVAQDDGTECSCVYDATGHFCTGCEDYCDLVIVEEVEEVEEPKRWAEDKNAKGEGWYIISSNSRIKHGFFTLNDKYNRNIFATKRQAKSALAMARISQLMAHDARYGGAITEEEWRSIKIDKFGIHKYAGNLCRSTVQSSHSFLAFHTKEQRELFLEENERLVKDYLMID